MTVINTNIKSLYTQAALKQSERAGQLAMQQLATGKRINSARDDAAGMAIASRMTQQIKGLNQANRNAGDAISLLQTYESATVEIGDMLQRMNELSVQAANATYSEDQRSYLDLEFQQLKEEINRIADTHEWNGFTILNRTSGDQPFSFQVGPKAEQVIEFHPKNFSNTGTDSILSDVTSDAGDGSTFNILTAEDASGAIDTLSTALDNVNQARSSVGAVMNRLEHTIDNLTSVSLNAEASRSQIEDADYAKASSELARTQIMQQAATAVLAQANTSQQTVLKLLQG